MTYLEKLERAGRRLATILTEIDATVRVIKSRPDWLSEADQELDVTERSLLLSAERIRQARLALTQQWRDWPESETRRQELIAAVETPNNPTAK